jgi:hypothetical protein
MPDVASADSSQLFRLILDTPWMQESTPRWPASSRIESRRRRSASLRLNRDSLTGGPSSDPTSQNQGSLAPGAGRIRPPNREARPGEATGRPIGDGWQISGLTRISRVTRCSPSSAPTNKLNCMGQAICRGHHQSGRFLGRCRLIDESVVPTQDHPGGRKADDALDPHRARQRGSARNGPKPSRREVI